MNEKEIEPPQIAVAILRCSRCKKRLAVVGDARTARCDNCGGAYKKKENGQWIGDLERWATIDGYKQI